MTVESIRFEDRYDDPLRDELVDLLRATAAVDATDGPRPHVWDHIEAAISERDVDDTVAGALPAPTPIAGARRRRARRTIGRVAAIAAAVSFVGGAALAALGPLSSRDPAPRPAPSPDVSPPSVETEARRAADRPGARIVQLTDAEGVSAVDVVMLPDGTAYVLGSQLPAGDAPYLLYAVVGETRVLLGTLLGDGAVRLDRIPAGALLFALVDEAGAVVAGAPLATSAEPAVPAEASPAEGDSASPSSEAPAPAAPAPFTPPPGAPSFPSPSAEQPYQAPPPPPDGVIDLPLLPPIHLPIFG
jgi:hypothetical protein